MGHRLHLLGGVALANVDGPLEGPVVRRHPLALLARLAVARGRPVGRDTLVALLWPEADASRARHSLSNVLSVLRRGIGEDALGTAGDDVRLDPARVSSDAGDFEDALERGRPEAAVELYRGPFLEGFHLPGSDTFEGWSREERDRFGRACGDALERLAEEAEARNDWRDAARWWERRVRLDPIHSRATLGLMSALVASGDRAEALRRGEAHVERIEAEFGMAPEPAVTALLDQIRGAMPPLHPVFHSRAFDRARDFAPKVAVLPFENLCGEADTYLVEGLANDVITRLSREEGISVLSRTTALRFRDGARSVREIEDETGARYVVEGAVQRVGDRVRVNVQLIDATEDRHLWARRYDRPAERVLELQTEIAEAIARGLGERPGRRRRDRRLRRGVPGGEAGRLYQRARFHGNRRSRQDVARAIALYEAAIDADPELAVAHAGLVDALFTARYLGHPAGAGDALARAREVSRRALALDPELPEAHVGEALIRWTDGDLPGAAEAFERALELDRGLVIAHHRYAILLAGLGRLEESLREILTALALDPLSPVLHFNVGIKYLFARDYDGAVRRFREAIRIEPTAAHCDAHSGIALARALQGREEEALAAAREALEVEPDSGDVRFEAAWILGTFGHEAGARAELREGLELGGNPVEAGIAMLPLGEIDAALDRIARGDWRNFDRPRRWDPRLDPVRTHPRFIDLLGA